MPDQETILERLLAREPRFPPEAYEFVDEALKFTQKQLRAQAKREGRSESIGHVSGRQLVLGIREYALQEFGLMAKAVFQQWNITRTGDFGTIVYNMIAEELMSKTDEDRREDFEDIFDLQSDLTRDFVITWEEKSA